MATTGPGTSLQTMPKAILANAIAAGGRLIQPVGTFTYTFPKPGRYGYHGNGFHGTVIVLPDSY